MLYKIKEWNYHYENSRSRSIAHCNWTPIPNKQDGLGYKRLVATHGNGPAHYGIWMAIVLLVSKQRSPREGYLTHNGKIDGEPLTPADIHLTTGMPEKLISEALPRFAQIGWAEVIVSDEFDTSLPPSAPERQGVATLQHNTTQHNTEKRYTQTSFDKFWEAWPKKEDKAKCVQWWERNKPDSALVDLMIKKVKELKATPQWEDRKYIPGPYKWLYGKRWEDEVIGGPPHEATFKEIEKLLYDEEILSTAEYTRTNRKFSDGEPVWTRI